MKRNCTLHAMRIVGWSPALLFTAACLLWTIETPAQQTTAKNRVYECIAAGQRVFSDQPCGGGAKTREIQAPNNMEGHDTSILGKTAPASKTKRPSSPDAEDAAAKKAQRCEKLREEKDTLNARMRAGYSGNSGERLRDRLRQINSDYYDLRC